MIDASGIVTTLLPAGAQAVRRDLDRKAAEWVGEFDAERAGSSGARLSTGASFTRLPKQDIGAGARKSRLMRFVQALIVVAAFAVVLTPDSLAVRFADTPCIEAGESRARICPAGAVGSPYVVRLTGEGGCGPDPTKPGSGLPYQFRLLVGSLPPGLSLDRDGLVHGTPTRAGTWSFWLELSDEDPPSAAWCVPKKSEREFIVAVGAPPGTVRSPYAVQVSAEGVGAQTWSIASGTLPPGLALRANTGVIAGTPEITGSFPLELSATDSRGVTATLDLTITVYPKFAFVTSQLVTPRIGRSYHATLRTTGGVRPLAFGVHSGRLPIGMRLNENTGVVSGRPRKPGVYRVTIQARDGLRRTATRVYVLTVRPPA
jgi:Putative Ig domain